MLVGKKVVLRPICKSDNKLFVRWMNDQEVNQFLNIALPINEIAEEKWIEKVSMQQNQVVLVIEDSNCEKIKPIGICSILDIHFVYRKADFGIVIGEKEYWEKGYGTESARLIINYAFNRLNLNRISSSIIDINLRSLTLHKKLGFKEEGRKRESFFKNGRYCDQIILGILRREWEEMSKK